MACLTVVVLIKYYATYKLTDFVSASGESFAYVCHDMGNGLTDLDLVPTGDISGFVEQETYWEPFEEMVDGELKCVCRSANGGA